MGGGENMKWLLFITIGAWLVIGGLIVNYNVAPFGSVTLRWRNLDRPTANFAWHVKPDGSGSIAGAVVVPGGETRRFSVTLPRGFRDGEMTVDYDADRAGQQIIVTGLAVAGKNVTIESNDRVAVLSYTWADLVAVGHRFEFAVTASVGDEPVILKSISIICRR